MSFNLHILWLDLETIPGLSTTNRASLVHHFSVDSSTASKDREHALLHSISKQNLLILSSIAWCVLAFCPIYLSFQSFHSPKISHPGNSDQINQKVKLNFGLQVKIFCYVSSNSSHLHRLFSFCKLQSTLPSAQYSDGC